MSEYFESIDELDLDKIQLDELIVALGSCLFSGDGVEEIDEMLLLRLD